MFFDGNTSGKIIIKIKEAGNGITTGVERKGIASDDKTAMSAILGTYISMCSDQGKDPIKLLQNNLEQLQAIIKSQNQ